MNRERRDERATRNLNREINYGAERERARAAKRTLQNEFELALRKRDESRGSVGFFSRSRIYVLASNPSVYLRDGR